MMLQMTLLGGPPWGLRLGGDQELRPVVSKILMGGRAARAGVRAGDLLQSVNSMPVFTCKQAHTLIQKAHGQLRLVVNRNVAGESAPASRFIRSIRSSTLPGPAQHAGGAGMKSVRLDLEAASGATKLKRRFFEEQIAKSSVTDRLLQRKIQLGMTHNGAPSESTIGYDSVEADFAGGQSNTTSNRTSPSVVNNRTILSLSASPASTGRAARPSLLRCPAIPPTGESTLL
ncbi:unnamed protein product [Heligmosomoides polygyrus]|uniref:PDZ domain-containing protein n=1 Tax=Heligmosomoides polygyrus TaxID=6339 RepID=A0A183G8A4_HELPZ|nr:unnamed protein product [Heligmosomoides polygyrus]